VDTQLRPAKPSQRPTEATTPAVLA
jgi:hypothetical protein